MLLQRFRLPTVVTLSPCVIQNALRQLPIPSTFSPPGNGTPLCSCEVVYFLAYQEGTLPLIYGHLMTTTSLSLVVCILLLCCVFILKNS